MEMEGKIWKDGKFWLVEISALDAMTQGKTRKEALAMAEDLVVGMARNRRCDGSGGKSSPGRRGLWRPSARARQCDPVAGPHLAFVIIQHCARGKRAAFDPDRE